ncbi:MAG: PSD1 and planctomycete cytochrome C domain-containing protein, partial [Gemmataceae bacterium]|nr:PSD1 and planctomycete cytochrome C domain-containing protein [Gemmataceae bacterium]
MISRVALSLGILLLPLGWCLPTAAAQDERVTPEQVEFFEKHVRPVLANHCYSCHSRQAKKLRGELYLDTRDGVRKGGTSGPALVPGKPDESLLIQAVRYHDKDLRMPPTGKLGPTEVADLTAWVRMGAPDPRTGAQLAKQGINLEEGRKHWSLQPLRAPVGAGSPDPAPPAVKDSSWPVSPVDRFILAKLEARGLRPVRLADRRTLLRRATFDLTGLPPTPEEIDAFLKDTSPEAFARVVERLLASPAYGERWGRHWLDVVRYADTAGDNSDYPIPQMYKYRNWVIDAFNRDLPYDQFVREQLAGDLMPATSEQDRRDRIIATGYLANSRRHGSYEDARYPWHLTIEDTIDNVGKVFLGVTLSCARCHDHKFDPFLAEDYYGLYGFFSSTRYPWPGIELDRVPKDLVALAPPAVVAKETKARQQKLSEMDAAIKRLEADKSALEKALRAAEKDNSPNPPLPGGGQGGVAALKKQVNESAVAIKTARKEREQFVKRPLPYETAYAVIDGPAEPKKRIGQVGNARLQLKGDPDRPGKEVPRRFLLVLGGQTLSPGIKGSGRLELAGWLSDPANPLVARVMVNRIWQYHFGRGLVATPNDFGKQGRPPTHPELLDFLAQRFIDSGWSVKQMHRLIMLSRVYQLASSDDEANLKADVGNDSLWRFPRHRLDAESIRDSLLMVSGTLDRSQGGPHPFPDQRTWDFTQHKPFKAVYDTNRRSVYLMTQRIQRHPFLATFDGPDTNASTAVRTTSTTSLQALFLMNDPFVHEQA